MARNGVLLIDDEEMFVDSSRKILQREGFREHCQIRPEEALEFFRTNHDTVGLAIVDVTMPGLTGFQLSRLFSFIDPEVPIILMCGSPISSQDITDLPNVKMVLQKPFIRREFVEAIASFVERIEDAHPSAP